MQIKNAKKAAEHMGANNGALPCTWPYWNVWIFIVYQHFQYLPESGSTLGNSFSFILQPEISNQFVPVANRSYLYPSFLEVAPCAHLTEHKLIGSHYKQSSSINKLFSNNARLANLFDPDISWIHP